jgi:hypothetical protein
MDFDLGDQASTEDSQHFLSDKIGLDFKPGKDPV